MVATFFFVSFILTVKHYNGSKDIIINAMAISSVLYAMLFLTNPVSSGCLNPAVGFV